MRHERAGHGALRVNDHTCDVRGVAATSDCRKLRRELPTFAIERVAAKAWQLVAEECFGLGASEGSEVGSGSGRGGLCPRNWRCEQQSGGEIEGREFRASEPAQ